MKRVLVIGIGAGDPDHVTLQAVAALNATDVFLVLDKGEATEDMVALRKEICARHITGDSYRIVEAADPARDLSGPSYRTAVAQWHAQRVQLYEHLLADEVAEHEVAAILAWGDPALYDSTMRILDEVRARGNVAFDYEVVPGISSVQVLAARHRIPLHAVGRPVHITTGRRLTAGWPDGADQVVIMIDGKGAFHDYVDRDLEIFWGAYLGTPDEILLSGPLHEMADEITRVRAEARARKGWLFDTYLLRPPVAPRS
ncbi:MAG TPA: precorrin-6A synthase (deacetylating) [Acidimicrobiales bacterium]